MSKLLPLLGIAAALLGSTSGCGEAVNQGASNRCERINPDEALIEKAKESIRVNPPCKVPDSPQKVVFGFSGLGGDGWMAGMVKGMTGGAAADFRYYPWHASNPNQLTNAALCAYAIATKRYQSSNGQVVYNSISMVGHSFGGAGAHNLAVILAKLGVSVDMVSTADAREPTTTLSGNAPNWAKPCNVGRWKNFYETTSTLRGYPINGTENIHVNCPGSGLAPHMVIVNAGAVTSGTADGLARTASCRADPAQPAGPGGACSGRALTNYAELSTGPARASN